MLHKFRFVIAGILIILVNQVVTFAVSANMPNSLLAAGTTRYAAAYATSTEYSLSPSWQDMPAMTKYITIPTGQTADVMVIFCGEVWTDSATDMLVRATVRDIVMAPDEITLLHQDAGASNRCAVFYKTNVTAGSPPVTIQWFVSGISFPQINVADRSMVVIVNTH